MSTRPKLEFLTSGPLLFSKALHSNAVIGQRDKPRESADFSSSVWRRVCSKTEYIAERDCRTLGGVVLTAAAEYIQSMLNLPKLGPTQPVGVRWFL